MYCPKCGGNISPETLVCEKCGEAPDEKEIRFQREITRLVPLAKEGDQDAITQLYNETYGRLLASLKAEFSGLKDEEEIINTAYTKAFSKIGSLNDESKFLPWLKRIAANTAYDEIRREKSRRTVKEREIKEVSFYSNNITAEIDAFEAPKEALEKIEISETFFTFINKLPDDQRLYVTLIYFNRYSVHEASELTGKTEKGIESCLGRARKNLKKEVLSFEKENGIKLHTLAPIPFLCWLYSSMEAEAAEITPPAGSVSKVLEAAGAASEAAKDMAGAAAAGEESAAKSGTLREIKDKVSKFASEKANRELIAASVAAAVAVGGTGAVMADRQEPHLIYASSVIEADAEVMGSDAALGEPDFEDGDEEYSTYAFLNNGSEIILSFDRRFTDLDGTDIVIYEIGPLKEETAVYVSSDLDEWYYVGDAGGGTSEIDISGYVPEGEYFKYVKLVDLKTYYRRGEQGADIDAVGVYVK